MDNAGGFAMLVLIVVAVVTAIAWIFLPFMIMSVTKDIRNKIDYTNELLKFMIERDKVAK